MIRLLAFGDPFLASEDGKHITGLSRGTRRFAVLIYLTCYGPGRPHRRDQLVAVFWPESDSRRGRNALRQTLHVIRSQLGPDLLKGNGSDEVWVDPDQLECDVGMFQQLLVTGQPEAALQLYRGDFLAGFHLTGAPAFGFWVEEQRAHLRELAIRATQNLAYQAEGRRDLPSALYWWRRALELHPFDDTFIRRIITLLAASGNRGTALAEFNRFRDGLAAELGLEPSEETLRLLEKVTHEPPQSLPQWHGDRRRGTAPRSPLHWRRFSDQIPA